MLGLSAYSYTSMGYIHEKLAEGTSLVKKHRKNKERKEAGYVTATGQRVGAGGYSGKYGNFTDQPDTAENLNPGSIDSTAQRTSGQYSAAQRTSGQQDYSQQDTYQPPPPSIPRLERRPQSGQERAVAAQTSAAPRQASQAARPTQANRGSQKQKPQRQSYHDRISNRFGGTNE